MRSLIFILATLFLTLANAVSAQDMQFSQVYSNPLYLNPGFAGTHLNTRIVANYRNQWPGLPHEYTAYGAGFDHYIANMKGGLGFTFAKDVAGTHNLSNTRVSLSYSQHVIIDRQNMLTFGVKGSLGQRSFDDSQLLFADQIITGAEESASRPMLNLAANYGDISVGGLFYNQYFFAGVSAHHLNRPNVSLMGGTEYIPVKLSIHGGAIIDLHAYRKRRAFQQINLAFNYKSQGNWDQLDIGGYMTSESVQIGLWYRGLPLKAYEPGYSNNESIVFLVGYAADKKLSMSYSFDLTISQLAGYSGGAHEIAIIYEIPHKKKPTRRQIIPCAKF